ncbi:MAG: DNA polymerase IV [Spirochaetes bacterium]|nr:DNA polymerase IV [Spirochaetota bacterium]
MDNVFFHIDMDAFYASVEQLDDTSLRNKPVIIGGSGKRGVVSTCSYEARVFGIRSAMPIEEARKKCPSGIFLPCRMERYIEVSNQIMEILKQFSPEVNVVSVDEAYLNMTGTSLIFGQPEEAAKKLKSKIKSIKPQSKALHPAPSAHVPQQSCEVRVRDPLFPHSEIKETAGLTVSVGIAGNRMMAKLASEFGKPDGLFRIEQGKEIEFLDSIKLKNLYGIGKKTLERLNQGGIYEIKQLRLYSKKMLSGMLGSAVLAEYIYKAVRGEDPGVWNDNPKSKSIGSEITFEEDIMSEDLLKQELLDFAQHLMFRLNDSEYVSKTVAIKIKYFDFLVTTAQTTLPDNISCSDEIYKTLAALLDKKLDRSKPVRLIGASLNGLEKREYSSQIDLFENNIIKKREVEKAVQALSKKKPELKIFKAAAIKKK